MTAAVEGFASRLADASLDEPSKLNVAIELRDSVELHHITADYELFVTQVVPVIMNLLETVPVSMYPQTVQQKLRKCLLDILSRLQTNEVLKPAAPGILKLVMSILHIDNEENGILCMKILTNLHRSYKSYLLDQVQPFFDFVIEVFKNIPGLVNELFNQPGTKSPATYSAQGSPDGSYTGTGTKDAQEGPPMLRAVSSFKVLTECPIIIVLLYSTHKQVVSQSLPVFVPYIVDTLSIEALPQAKEHEAAASKNEIYTGISPAIKDRPAYNDFIVSQIKIMSFLAYALRAYSASLQNYYNLVPNFVVRLLKDCPAELSSARKELLVSMRHILSTYFRTFFIPKVDVLLEERVLIGVGLTAQETLWPLAYSTMADLIHHVRNELSVAQIWKAIRVYCKNLHKHNLPTSFQIMSAKLLLNFIERIMSLPDRQEGRQIMLVILCAFVDRFAELNRRYIDLVDPSKKAETDMTLYKVVNDQVIKIHADVANNELKDARYIFKNLMNFLKTVMFGFKSCNSPPQHPNITTQQWEEAARGFSYDDINLFRRLFREGVTGQMFFASQQKDSSLSERYDAVPVLPIVTSRDEKELMEAFATVFIHLDPATFNEILEAEMEFFYEAIFKNTALLHVAQLFLGSETTSANFSATLLGFLKKKLPELGDGDSHKSNILIRLFKLCFMAVNLFPVINEAVILPHFKDFIVEFLNLTSQAKEPIVYFHLLRALFRSIGGGRFESLYKAVLPLLQVLLETLNRRLEMARKPSERDMYVELCLTVPVRLSLLVPHLSYLMRPLVLALNGSPELVSQGLRTLELCVDNLTAAYFDPIIEPVLDEVMTALWSQLKPLPYPHQQSHATLRILGKLGGRNRAFLGGPKDLESVRALDQDISVMIAFKGLTNELPVRITPGVNEAIKILENPLANDIYKGQAYDLLATTIKQFIDSHPIEDAGDYALAIQKCVKASASSTFEDAQPLEDGSSRDLAKRDHINELCERILEALFFAAAVDSLRDRAEALVKNLCEHFTLLELGEFTIEKRRAMRSFNLNDHEGIPCIEPRTIIPPIVSALSHLNEHVRNLGYEAMKTIFESGRTICGPHMDSYRYPMVRALYSKLSHGCFAEPYYRKAGACRGLKYLLEDLSLSLVWLKARQVELVRTIFFVIKDVPNDAPCSVRENASQLLLYIIEKCNSDVLPEQTASRPFILLESLLSYELESANSAVRELAKKALKKLSEVIDQPLTEILSQVTHVFLTPIFGKPLRALPFPMQIGYIDAISFCLELSNTFLRFNEKLTRLLEEALALVDAEDESLTSAHRVFEYSTSQQLADLRVVCIKLLSLALTTSDHLATHHPQMRAKIITVLFKTLSSSSPKVVAAAHDALKALLSQYTKLPKDLLQNGLRPILVNLSDHSRLTVSGLDSLARLLELLTYYFKVEIGNKLLDHLRAWTDPSKLLPISNNVLIGEEPIDIAVAILNVFHLLPPTAHMFIPDIIAQLHFMESNLRLVQSSPFREPIAKFLEKHPAETFNYFQGKLNDPVFGRLFVDFLGMPVCEDIRAYCKEHIDLLRQEILRQDRAEDKCVGICNLIFIMQVLGRDTSWLGERKSMIQNLTSSIGDLMRTTITLPAVSPLHLEIQAAVEDLQGLVAKFTLANFEHSESGSYDAELLFLLINSVALANIDYSWQVIKFIFVRIVKTPDVDIRRYFLEQSLELAAKTSTVLPAKLFLITYFINPILEVEIDRNGDLTELVSKIGTGGWLDTVHSQVWLPTTPPNSASTINKYQLALLDMSVLILRSSPQMVSEVRKDIIKFGWSFLKYEDILSKMSAYVLVTYFIVAYDTLPKIAVQIYVALLKTHQSEAKTVVNQALEVIAPVLTKRVNSPLWAKWPRRILGEDGHNVTQVGNIYLFISKNADLFYEYRSHFVPFIVAAMAKLSYLPNVTVDIDLAQLLVAWERRSKDEEASGAVTVPDAVDTKSPDSGEVDTYHMPFAQREAVITYLVRYVCTLSSKATENPQGRKVLDVLNALLGPNMWDDVEVRLNFFDRSLVQSDLATPAAIISGLNALEVARIALKHKSSKWIRDNTEELTALLERSLRCSNSAILQACSAVVGLVLVAYENEPERGADFLRVVYNAVQDQLGSSPPALGWVYLAQQLYQFNPNSVNGFIAGAIKALGRASKEYMDAAHTGPPNSNGASTGGAAQLGAPDGAVSASPGANTNESPVASKSAATEPESVTIPILIEMLDLISSRISHLGDQRRVFLSLVAQLIERVNDMTLSFHIVQIVRKWVFSRTELFPTAKEKAALIHKMLNYDSHKDSKLTEQYYSIIIDVFGDEHLSKTELPARLEQPFLVGTTLGATPSEVSLRDKLIQILGDSLEPNVMKRFGYIFMEQNWEPLSDHYWLNEALQLLYGCVEEKKLHLQEQDYKYASFDIVRISLPIENGGAEMVDTKLAAGDSKDDVVMESVDEQTDSESFHHLLRFIERRSDFVQSFDKLKCTSFMRPVAELQYQSNDLTHDMWVDLFPLLYNCVPPKAKHELIQAIVVLLARDYHTRQADSRPNVIKTLLEGIAKVEFLPPQLVKYIAGNYGAWHAGIQILERIQASPPTESTKVADSNLDALAELYAGIQENDMFYGLWRTRSKFIVTNSALSYEQCGMWSRAMQMHETAQIKARSGVLPYGESEYGLWEDHWILCAEKLQHWDVLTELAKHEGFNDLLLECGWRVADWISDKEPLEQSIKSLMDVPTPRRQVFETFLCLQGFAQKTETLQTLGKCCDEGIQLALRKWHGLPKRITGAHIPLLHTFQQYVEFMEASQVYTSLASTTSVNLEHKSQELKGILQAWHERLPNMWDDINIWSDLVTWRQHVFGVINKVYLPLIPAVQQSSAGSTSNNSAAYRGYHEIAWIINRFAHVARKHGMTDVCINLLSKIYTLPNIEIQEAFLKLREQAKCHYQNPNDVSTGLEVISNTNFAFFGAQQKSEFFTLRGMSLAKLGAEDHANEQFATAVQLDVYLPKAWAEWGRFNDRRFKDHPEDINYGATAVSCYLQAAGLYKNAKCRKLLGRILWLLSLDDKSGAIATAFTNYRGEVPVWYWVTFIPQLLISLAHKEGRLTSKLLIKIAKSYPQALHFQLRTARDEYALLQKQTMHGANRSQNASIGKAVNQGAGGAPSPGGQAGAVNSPNTSLTNNVRASPGIGENSALGEVQEESKRPWEYVDEIMAILKTAYPLLALSLETLVDQIVQRFKSPADEDAYRLIVALLNDGVQYMSRLQCPSEDVKLPAATESSIARFADGVLPKHVKAAFEADFITAKPNLETYVLKLREWRNRFEAKLDARPKRINLEALSPPLSEFHYQKFEEIEVPGQNQELKDSNLHFVKIGRFLSNVDVVSGYGICYRRLTIRGHDGSTHPFAVQYPAARHCRREERVTQLFRILNNVMSRRKESRSRHLQFTLPIAVPLNGHIRIVQDSPDYVSFYQIYEKFCKTRGQSRDAPFDFSIAEMRAAFDPRLPKPDTTAVKMEILAATQSKLVPPTIMRDYFTSQYRSFEEFWVFRKQFAYQYAGITFMTVMMSINNRYPHKFLVNMSTGNIWATEMLPILPANKNAPTFLNGEPVPFRLTPNIQTLMGPTTTEGLFAMAIMVIAKGLTDPEFDLAQYLPIFVRDELMSWYTQQGRPAVAELPLREIVRVNVDTIVKRATSLAQTGQGNIPANQTVIDLISMAVNPRNLALADALWMPYY